MNKPLVTFALIMYNQERFVCEAVRGALAQTYSPLQIILSDDCSQDNTFEILREEVANYEGPHQILVNRNERNLNIGGHVNRVMQLAQGELIVVAAGDDVSLPTRTEELVRAWSEDGVYYVFSNVIVLDEGGMDRGKLLARGKVPARVYSWQEVLQHKTATVLGCSAAWDRSVWDTFGPLPNPDMAEDLVLRFRSSLLGKIAYVDKCLVKWRRHELNRSGGIETDQRLKKRWPQFRADMSRWEREYAEQYEVWLRDVHLFLSLHPEMEAELSEAIEIVAARIVFHRFRELAMESDGIGRLRNLPRVIKKAKILGIKTLLQACFLSASPMNYYRVQKWYRKLAH